MNASRSQQTTRKAIKDGKIILPDTCQICGIPSGQKRLTTDKPAKIIPHHYKGYDFPYDVWFLCGSCNRKLHGKHDNSLSLQDAKNYVTGKNHIKESYLKSIEDEIARIDIQIESLLNRRNRLRSPAVNGDSLPVTAQREGL